MGQIQREIKQRRPFPAPSQEAVVGLLRTTDLLRRVLASVVEPARITLQQYNVLRILRGTGPEGLPTLEIAGRMIEQAPGITRLLDRLEAKRLVRRHRCPRDRRRVLCTITPAGGILLTELDRPVADASAAFCRGLGVGRTRRLIRLLDEVRAADRDRLLSSNAKPNPRRRRHGS